MRREHKRALLTFQQALIEAGQELLIEPYELKEHGFRCYVSGRLSNGDDWSRRYVVDNDCGNIGELVKAICEHRITALRSSKLLARMRQRS